MITPTRFRNKTTGEIVTQVPILDIANYEEMPSEEAKAIIRPEWDKMQEYITDTEEKELPLITTVSLYVLPGTPANEEDRYIPAATGCNV